MMLKGKLKVTSLCPYLNILPISLLFFLEEGEGPDTFIWTTKVFSAQ